MLAGNMILRICGPLQEGEPDHDTRADTHSACPPGTTARTQCDAEEAVEQHAEGRNQQHNWRERVMVACAQRAEHLAAAGRHTLAFVMWASVACRDAMHKLAQLSANWKLLASSLHMGTREAI